MIIYIGSNGISTNYQLKKTLLYYFFLFEIYFMSIDIGTKEIFIIL